VIDKAVPEKRWKIGRREKIGKIRDAAIAQFCKHGYAGSSLNDVAGIVEMHKATLYHYFPSKELLLAHILDYAHDQIAEIRASVEALDVNSLDRLRALLKFQVSWYLENVDLARVTFHEWTNVGDDLIEAQTERRRTFDRFLRSLILRAQQDGLIDSNVHISMAANHVTGAMNAAPTWFRPDGSFSAEKVADMFADMSLRTLGAKVAFDTEEQPPVRVQKRAG
jgi:AcrR family transcriptional regulator